MSERRWDGYNCPPSDCAIPNKKRRPSPQSLCSVIRVDGREFQSPLDAALHLLWLLQRLSYYEPEREGMPTDGPRFRECIIEARKLLDSLGYDKSLNADGLGRRTLDSDSKGDVPRRSQNLLVL